MDTIQPVNIDFTVINDTLELRIDEYKDYYFTKIYLKEDLETWASGRSDVYAISSFIQSNGKQYKEPTIKKIDKVKEKNLNKWIDVKNVQVTGGDKVIRPFVIFDWILFEKDVRKSSWKRKFEPWIGECGTQSDKTYYYYSKQNKFFHRTFSECGRYYYELPEWWAITVDKKWTYPNYSGYCITSSSKTIE